MPLKPRHETPIERIFREVTGRKMPASVKRILLPKPRPIWLQKRRFPRNGDGAPGDGKVSLAFGPSVQVVSCGQC